MKCLCEVMFAVSVHGCARRMWHPFVCGVEVSLGHLKVSDLVFCYVLVRPSLILHCSWYAIVEPLVGVSSVAVSAAPVVAAQLDSRRIP